MKKAIVTGALLMTTLGGATAAGAATALPAAATSGCGITIHVHNQANSAIKVQWDKSDSRIKAGWWKKLGSGTTTVQASNTASKAFTLSFSCSTNHRYRIHYTQGSNSGYSYYPSSSGWTTKSNFTVNVK